MVRTETPPAPCLASARAAASISAWRRSAGARLYPARAILFRRERGEQAAPLHQRTRDRGQRHALVQTMGEIVGRLQEHRRNAVTGHAIGAEIEAVAGARRHVGDDRYARL